jgi:hypothetical protein
MDFDCNYNPTQYALLCAGFLLDNLMTHNHSYIITNMLTCLPHSISIKCHQQFQEKKNIKGHTNKVIYDKHCGITSHSLLST